MSKLVKEYWKLVDDLFTFFDECESIMFTWEIQYLDKLKEWYKGQPRDEYGFLVDEGEAIYKGLNSCSSRMRNEWLFVLENELTLIEFYYAGFSDGMAVELDSSKDFSIADGFHDYLNISEWV